VGKNEKYYYQSNNTEKKIGQGAHGVREKAVRASGETFRGCQTVNR